MTKRDCFCFDRQRTLNAAVLTKEHYARLKDFINLKCSTFNQNQFSLALNYCLITLFDLFLQPWILFLIFCSRPAFLWLDIFSSGWMSRGRVSRPHSPSQIQPVFSWGWWSTIFWYFLICSWQICWWVFNLKPVSYNCNNWLMNMILTWPGCLWLCQCWVLDPVDCEKIWDNEWRRRVTSATTRLHQKYFLPPVLAYHRVVSEAADRNL